MRFTIAAMSAIAMSAMVANAGDVSPYSGSFSLGYARDNIANTDIDTYSFSGAVNYALGSGFNIQLNAEFAEPKVETVPLDHWSIGGVISYRTADYAAGFYGNNTWIKAVGVTTTYGDYGLVGEYYPTADFTVRLRGGAVNWEGMDGGQLGGGISFYLVPNVSLNLDAVHLGVSSLHRTTYNVGAEYQPFESFPLAISAAYNYTQYNAGNSSCICGGGVMFRLTYRFGNGTTLVERDRNGPLNTLPAPFLMD